MIIAQNTSSLGKVGDDQYLRLPDANIVATDSLCITRENLEEVIAAKAMMCIHGDAGLGKTFSVNASLRDIAPQQSYRIQFRARPTPRYIRSMLFDALAIVGKPPSRPAEFDRLLKGVLAEEFRIFICDEAQWQSTECFEYWRHLWDDKHTDMAVVFVGGGDCYRVLSREPMLASRIYIWQEFRRMSLDQVYSVIPAFHPIWEDADPVDIEFVDDKAAHGNFRSWAKITLHTVRALSRAEQHRVDRDVLLRVFSKLGGRS
ncbi:ATP-binding protein [Streptosporangium sp. NPDC049248]|uniref:ATP-binding protein n=1 Tax=Streptosporangium sp. NPDC049248 TaxID=3155651 RepID=UPI003416D9FE